MFAADLHIHSRFSRATSPDMSPEGLWKWAQLKGLTVIGTGDFTHPGWLHELRDKLDPLGNGLYVLKRAFQSDGPPASCRSEVCFMLTAEVSCIYAKGGRTRKVHAVLLAPDFRTVRLINEMLKRVGSLASDGRPILGLDAKKLLSIVMDASPAAMLIPAHAWTPHFSVFGAASGFDSMEECFEELTPHIHAIETGLSSDPAMNWRLSSLDRFTLLSNSDAHSLGKLGREATLFETAVSFDDITTAIATKQGIVGTIEFFPEEGKYYYDGHRKCSSCLHPRETLRHRYLCPVCGRKVTVGVMHRVASLADRPEGYTPPGSPPFRTIIPLAEVMAEAIGRGVNTKGIQKQYLSLLSKLGSELKVLLDSPLGDIEKAATPRLRKAIERMRRGEVTILPGYDGEYGKASVFKAAIQRPPERQTALI